MAGPGPRKSGGTVIDSRQRGASIPLDRNAATRFLWNARARTAKVNLYCIAVDDP